MECINGDTRRKSQSKLTYVRRPVVCDESNIKKKRIGLQHAWIIQDNKWVLRMSRSPEVVIKTWHVDGNRVGIADEWSYKKLLWRRNEKSFTFKFSNFIGLQKVSRLMLWFAQKV